jgi:hypothetical protein
VGEKKKKKRKKGKGERKETGARKAKKKDYKNVFRDASATAGLEHIHPKP